jgi:hypothetical protein
MSKVILLVIFLSIIGGSYYFYSTLQKPQTITQNESPKIVSTVSPSPKTEQTMDACEVLTKGSADVPSLYADVTWSVPKMSSEDVLEYDASDNVIKNQLEGCLVLSTTIGREESNKIKKHYYQSLSGNGWKEVMSTDGPNGSTISYRKNAQFLLVDVRISSVGSVPQYNVKLFYSQ